ncbi:hypothetical protein ACEPAF_1001 [Sanghuangporus sanghuang]
MLSRASQTAIGHSEDKATCGICRRQVSRYTCPSCNVAYCSLSCFRSNEHSQCSEAFYKHQLESEIRTQPSASTEERRRMLEMLKQFEQEGVDEDLLEGEEENGDDNLAERLGGIDLESASASDIWNALTSEERATFLRKIQDPTSSSTRELLRNAGNELKIVLPWWEAPEAPPPDSSASIDITKNYGSRPAMEEIPKTLLSRQAGPETGPLLLYNICAVFIAYAYVTRHLGISPLSQSRDGDDLSSARQLLRTLLPFLAEKRSTILFGSMDDLITDMWSRLVQTKKTDRTSFVLLLRDALLLLTPRRIAIVDTSDSGGASSEQYPQQGALLALSDLIGLIKSRSQSGTKDTPASHKLRFYAAHIATLPSQLLAAFSAEVGARARSIEIEDAPVSNEAVTSEARTGSALDGQERKPPEIKEI